MNYCTDCEKKNRNYRTNGVSPDILRALSTVMMVPNPILNTKIDVTFEALNCLNKCDSVQQPL